MNARQQRYCNVATRQTISANRACCRTGSGPCRHEGRMPRGSYEPTDRYMVDFASIIRQMTTRFAVQVGQWTKDTCGSAWEDSASDGATLRYIESPYPNDSL